MQSIISVIVPIYNVEDYLERCIKSILNQTFTKFELILVDDGATDTSPVICDQYEKLDSRIRVIHKENGGLSDARNKGLNCAKGEYICFIDSDDYIHPKYLEVLYDICLKYGCDIAVCGYEETTGSNISNIMLSEEIKILNSIEMLEYTYDNHFAMGIVAWNKLYKREVIGQDYYPVGQIHEDEATTYKYILNAKKIGVTTIKLYYYFQRENSIMGKSFSEKRLDYFTALESRMKVYKEQGLEKFYQMDIILILQRVLEIYSQLRKPVDKKINKRLKEQYRRIYKYANRKNWSIKQRIMYKICFYLPLLYGIKQQIQTKRCNG